MTPPIFAELPPPPAGRWGWPWQDDGTFTIPSLGDQSSWPRITIVTPSFNQGLFLEETIRSVLLQGYPNLEYIIIDGGSTDHSVEIIKKYEPWLAYWVREKDRGQSHAINKGWQRATGDLLAWLCSDDVYCPGALAYVAEAWRGEPDAAVIVGAVQSTDERSRPLGSPNGPRLPNSGPLDLTLIDHEKWFLPQPSGFWSWAALDKVGRWVREDLHYTMDRELYYRLCSQGRTLLLGRTLATYRLHAGSKSVSATLKQFGEAPKALAYCGWGGPKAQRRRIKVGQWRVSQGHFKFGRACENWALKLQHLFLAAVYRPAYIRRRAFWAAALDAFGLMRPLRRFRNALVKPVIQSVQIAP